MLTVGKVRFEMDIHSAVLQQQLRAEIEAERARFLAEGNAAEQAANVHAGDTWGRSLESTWPFTLAKEGYR
jgi:hypothetical protein